MKKSAIVLFTILCIGNLSFSRKPKIRLTPHNAVSLVYKHMKSLRFSSLLPFLHGKEKRKFSKIIKKMKRDHKLYWKLKKQTQKIAGFKILKKEIYKNIALVNYAWKIIHLKPIPGKSYLKKKKIVLVVYKVLLLKKNKRWYIVDTKSVLPKREVGMQAYKKAKRKKLEKMKSKSKSF